MAQASRPSLRDCQIDSIEKILNLNAPLPSTGSTDNFDPKVARLARLLQEDGNPIWKILVLDQTALDTISSVMNVSDLRSCGVTNHVLIKNKRTAVRGVPVVYFVDPTEENFRLIAKDIAEGIYSSPRVNFIQSVTRPLLERFAAIAAEEGVFEEIEKVYDQYLNFVVTEPDLFSLNMGLGSYQMVETGSGPLLESFIDKVVSGLFSVSVTMKTVPIIRCPKEGVASSIAAKLDRKLRDHMLNSKDNLFSQDPQRWPKPSSRPLMVIVDRKVDLIPMVSHSWTYRSLVTDILGMKRNVVTITREEEGKAPSKKTVALDAKDFIWSEHSGSQFLLVTEAIDSALVKYQADMQEITNAAGVDSLDDIDKDGMDSLQQMKGVIGKLPLLQERKRIIDKHLDIATTILENIKARGLDQFYEWEGEVHKLSASQVMSKIQADENGSNPNDKVRFFLFWYLGREEGLDRVEFHRFQAALEATGADIAPLRYIYSIRSQTDQMGITTTGQDRDGKGQSSQAFASTSLSHFTNKIKETGLGNVFSGLQNYFPRNTDFTLTKIVESLMDPQNARAASLAKIENYLYFDPRSADARGTAPSSGAGQSRQSSDSHRGIDPSLSQKRQGFPDAIVFTVGGGSMDEFGNLQDWVHRKNGTTPGGANNAHTAVAGARKRIVYGSTELLSPEGFLEGELGALGRSLAGATS